MHADIKTYKHMLGRIPITLSAHLCAQSLVEGHVIFALLGLSLSADTHTQSAHSLPCLLPSSNLLFIDCHDIFIFYCNVWMFCM